MLSEFKKFILKGNIIELAVAVIIGAAFNQIVNSMVVDVITPLIGLIGGSPDFSAIKIGPINIGKFINAILNFIIVAAVIFFGIIKPVKKLQELSNKKENVVTPTPVVSEEAVLLRGILEEMKKGKQ